MVGVDHFRDVRSFTFAGYSTRLRARCMHGKWLSASCSFPSASPCLIDWSTIIKLFLSIWSFCLRNRKKQNYTSKYQIRTARISSTARQEVNRALKCISSYDEQYSDASHESEGQDAFPKEESLKKPSIARYFLCCVFFFSMMKNVGSTAHSVVEQRWRIRFRPGRGNLRRRPRNSRPKEENF